MVKDGRFQLTDSQNTIEFFKAMGIDNPTEQQLTGLSSANTVLSFTINGNKWSYKTQIGDSYTRETSFTIGETFEEEIPGGKNVKSTATVDGNKLTIKTTDGVKSGGRLYEFSDTGLTMVLLDNPAAKRTYKRI